ncbi:hypothetical protein [Methanobrevibacter olleyae]|uniref:DUF4367 domain-containing protein n=1 Tax=Methanobrevibacter olleyae TaxID=294671 RepID=A0A126QZK0_METOL|nr:hypothetical protein [Methanobrevibacter olleyae]AMK15232.1 hypothetical protein YLM1_0675 [Methanobrevibacter olleyae]
MKFNRIVILTILAILAVVLAASASAFDLGFLGGSDSEPQKITVGGIDFQIPAGFTENEKYRMDNETSSSSGSDYYMSAVGYEDGSKQNAIYVMVADYGEYNVTDDVLNYVAKSMDGKKKTINGHAGYIAKQTDNSTSSMLPVTDDIYMFMYEENGDLVFIGATDESYFNDVVLN